MYLGYTSVAAAQLAVTWLTFGVGVIWPVLSGLASYADTWAGKRWPVATALLRAVAAQGDRTAFAALFAHFAPRIKTYLLRLGLPAAQAEEVARCAAA